MKSVVRQVEDTRFCKTSVLKITDTVSRMVEKNLWSEIYFKLSDMHFEIGEVLKLFIKKEEIK